VKNAGKKKLKDFRNKTGCEYFSIPCGGWNGGTKKAPHYGTGFGLCAQQVFFHQISNSRDVKVKT
jgi:hypothetical protein